MGYDNSQTDIIQASQDLPHEDSHSSHGLLTKFRRISFSD